MAVNAENIIFGAARLYIGAFGATEPATIDAEIDPAQFIDVGATTEGVKFTYEPEFADIAIDQVYGAVGARKIGHTMGLATVFSEGTLENFETLLGGGTITVNGTERSFELASLTGGAPEYLAIIAEGPGPKGKKRRLIARKCLATGTLEFGWMKDEQSGLTAEFTVYETGTDVRALRIVDEYTAPVTP